MHTCTTESRIAPFAGAREKPIIPPRISLGTYLQKE